LGALRDPWLGWLATPREPTSAELYVCPWKLCCAGIRSYPVQLIFVWPSDRVVFSMSKKVYGPQLPDTAAALGLCL